MKNLSQKQNIEQRIKVLTNRIQLLTESQEDKATRVILMESLRDLQRKFAFYL